MTKAVGGSITFIGEHPNSTTVVVRGVRAMLQILLIPGQR